MISRSFTLPCHPHDVKPAGNAWTGTKQMQWVLGPLTDEIFLMILAYLDPRSLLAVGKTCKALYAFSHFDDLWRARAVQTRVVPQAWEGSWYASYMNIPASALAKVSASGLASDAIYRPFLCANTPLLPYVYDIPKSNEICRMHNLSWNQFKLRWVDKPFILTDPVKEWPISRTWSTDYLLKRFGETIFRAESVDWPFSTYVAYMRQNTDESPLYLFDRAFVEKMNLIAKEGGDFWPPECFGDDVFALLGEHRPDRRWLIIGPERSGSTFHKDPNATSAWNAVIEGCKYWIMFPSGPGFAPPPGVFVSADQSEVTSPLSIAEWLLNFHQAARAAPGCREGICRSGEVLHVPSGWWHLVVNIEPSIAITQNFVPNAHLAEVLLFLRDKADQVSGFKESTTDPYSQLLQAVRLNDANRASRVEEEMKRKPDTRKRKWHELTRANMYSEGSPFNTEEGFSFGFNEED